MPLLLCLCLTTQTTYARKRKTAPATVPVMTQQEQRFRYYFYEAQRCLEFGQYGQAMALLLFLDDLAPEADAATNRYLGYMYQAVGDENKALHYLRLAYRQTPDAYWQPYTALLFQKKDYDEAARVLESVTAAAPANTEAWEALLSVYASQGRTGRALKVQDKIEALEGVNSYNVMSRYKINLAAGKTKEAIRSIERYVEQNPEDYRFAAFLGDLYMNIGYREKALEIYAAEKEKHPDNPYVYMSLADYYRTQNNPVEAADHVRKALQSDEWDLQQKLYILESNQEQLQEMGNLLENSLVELLNDYPLEESAYKALSNHYLLRKQYDKVKPLLQTMIDINPQNKDTWRNYLNLLQADSTSSDEEYAHVIRQAYLYQPDDLEWSWWMTRLLILEGNIDAALEVAQTDMQQRTENPQYKLGLWVLIGDIQIEKQQFDAAFAAYEEALLLNPDNVYVLNNYAYTLAVNDGDLKKAERMSQKTIEKEPDNATYLDTYAWILHLQGQDMLAEFYIKRAIDNIRHPNEEEEIRQHYQVITQSARQ